MINTSRDMKYIARHVSRQKILRKIINDAETLANAARERLDDPTSKEAAMAMCDAVFMLFGTLEILNVQNGYSPDMAMIGRINPFYINDWANSLREAKKHD